MLSIDITCLAMSGGVLFFLYGKLDILIFSRIFLNKDISLTTRVKCLNYFMCILHDFKGEYYASDFVYRS